MTRYGYDDRSNLVSVTWPDQTARTYHYEDIIDPRLLTGLTDERGIRVETYRYDDRGRPIESGRIGGADRIQVEYGDQERTVIEALGSVRTHRYQTIDGIPYQIELEQTGPKGVTGVGKG